MGLIYLQLPINTKTSVYYHHIVERPLKLYYDILGYPIYNRYWYRYWYDVPKSRYADYYYNDIINYSYYYPSYLSRVSWDSYLPRASYKYWYSRPLTSSRTVYYDEPSWYKLSPSWWKHWYPAVSSSWHPRISTAYVSPYWPKYWTSYDSPYYWSTYWQPSWSRYWRSAWNSNWTRWYDIVSI